MVLQIQREHREHPVLYLEVAEQVLKVQEVREVRGESGLLLSKLTLDGYRNLLLWAGDDYQCK